MYKKMIDRIYKKADGLTAAHLDATDPGIEIFESGYRFQSSRKPLDFGMEKVSIQAGEMLYSEPRENGLPGKWYSRVELGFPTWEDWHLREYAEDPGDLTGTVYPYTPVKLVDRIIFRRKLLAKAYFWLFCAFLTAVLIGTAYFAGL